MGTTIPFLRPLRQAGTAELNSKLDKNLLSRVIIICKEQGLASIRKIIMYHEVIVYLKSLMFSV